MKKIINILIIQLIIFSNLCYGLGMTSLFNGKKDEGTQTDISFNSGMKNLINNLIEKKIEKIDEIFFRKKLKGIYYTITTKKGITLPKGFTRIIDCFYPGKIIKEDFKELITTGLLKQEIINNLFKNFINEKYIYEDGTFTGIKKNNTKNETEVKFIYEENNFLKCIKNILIEKHEEFANKINEICKQKYKERNIAHEIKAIEKFNLKKPIKEEIEKDVLLREKGIVGNIYWHFIIKPSDEDKNIFCNFISSELFKKLVDSNIKIIFYSKPFDLKPEITDEIIKNFVFENWDLILKDEYLKKFYPIDYSKFSVCVEKDWSKTEIASFYLWNKAKSINDCDEIINILKSLEDNKMNSLNNIFIGDVYAKKGNILLQENYNYSEAMSVFKEAYLSAKEYNKDLEKYKQNIFNAVYTKNINELEYEYYNIKKAFKIFLNCLNFDKRLRLNGINKYEKEKKPILKELKALVDNNNNIISINNIDKLKEVIGNFTNDKINKEIKDSAQKVLEVIKGVNICSESNLDKIINELDEKIKTMA